MNNKILLLLISVGMTFADLYLHVPRGSNNRLNEKSAARKNANRMFDSQVSHSFSNHSLFQRVLHNLCNKGCGMCYPVCGMMHIKEPLLLIRKRISCGSSGFPFSLSGPLPYV